MNSIYMKTAIGAALKSGRLIKDSVGKCGSISYKGHDNIVTQVDRAAEEVIVNIILSAFPDHSILAEESSPLNGRSPYRWLVDPLDGTTNFARSFPFFCVSIALEYAGRPVLGVVYDPMREELFRGLIDKGAYLNKKRIRVSRVRRLQDAFLATGFSYGKTRKDRNVPNFRKFLLSSLAVRRAGSAALDLCYVACGRFDGFWELDLHPWDSAAGAVIVREAGGSVTKFGGSLYTPYDKEILATNSLIQKQMTRVLSRR